MRAPRKLVLFAVLLAAMFGGGYVVGELVGPFDTVEPAHGGAAESWSGEGGPTPEHRGRFR